MRRNRFQNMVATSSFTLPVAALVATILWIAGISFTYTVLVEWLVWALTTYLLIEFNNRFALIRIRSRLTPTFFLIGYGCFHFLQHDVTLISIAFLCLASLYYLFRSYQQTHSAGNIYHVFLFLGIASVLQFKILFFIPFLYWSMGSYFRSFSLKSFCASLVGLCTPYWFAGAYSLLTQEYSWLLRLKEQALAVHLPSLAMYQQLSWTQISAALLITALGIIGSVHLLRTSHNDKIRTRMQFNTLILLEWVTLFLMLLFPEEFNSFFMVLMLLTAPILAHFFALTSSKITNILFIITIILYLQIAFLELWISLLQQFPIFS